MGRRVGSAGGSGGGAGGGGRKGGACETDVRVKGKHVQQK